MPSIHLKVFTAFIAVFSLVQGIPIVAATPVTTVFDFNGNTGAFPPEGLVQSIPLSGFGATYSSGIANLVKNSGESNLFGLVTFNQIIIGDFTTSIKAIRSTEFPQARAGLLVTFVDGGFAEISFVDSGVPTIPTNSVRMTIEKPDPFNGDLNQVFNFCF